MKDEIKFNNLRPGQLVKCNLTEVRFKNYLTFLLFIYFGDVFLHLTIFTIFIMIYSKSFDYVT